jgi:hypothetical protein
MKTSQVLTILGIIAVLFLFRFIGKKLSKKVDKLHEEEGINRDLTYELPKEKKEEEGVINNEVDELDNKLITDAELEKEVKVERISKPKDYNGIQNLTEHNHGTYRGTDGRFKSKKKWEKTTA